MEGEQNQIAEKFNELKSITFKDFIDSNTVVSKIAFTLLVMFIFYILLKFSISAIPAITRMSEMPHIFDGTVEGKNAFIVSQDPSLKNSITVNRSINEQTGIEFSWSVWLFIDDSTIDISNSVPGEQYHIFHKGGSYRDTSSGIYNISAPGLYGSRSTNELTIMMNSFNKSQNKIVINNVPLNKWIHLIIRCKNKQIDIYVNGYVKKSVVLDSLPKQNDGDVYISQYKYTGKLSNLWYYDKALNIFEIKKIFMKGPNLQLVIPDSSRSVGSKIGYLGFDWYYNNSI